MIILQALRRSAQFFRTQPWVFKYIGIAIATNIVISIISLSGIWWGLFQSGQGISGFFIEDTNALIQVILLLFSFLIALLTVVYTFSIISSIANAPIYGHLVDRILAKHQDIIDIDESISWVDATYLTVVHEGKKFALIIFFIVITLALGLVPVIGPFLSIALTLAQLIVISGLDMLEPIFIHTRIGFRAKIRWISKRFKTYGLFLLICGFILPIPIVNIFALPFLHVLAIQMYILSEAPEIEDPGTAFVLQE